ncbi:hypothetical protein BH09ACT4_BH09ACT4_12420 [soil metagenome]
MVKEQLAPAASESAEYNKPTIVETKPSRGVGPGILIAVITAALVGGLGIGGVGGFALANAGGHDRPAISQQGPGQPGGQPGNQQGPPQGGQGGIPGQPPQGGPQNQDDDSTTGSVPGTGNN